MSRNESRASLFLFLLAFFVLAITNLFLLLSNHNLFLGLILNSSFTVLIFALLFYWPNPFLPQLKLSEKISIATDYLIHRRLNLVNIDKGQFQSDYPLLKKKPNHFFLCIDQKSAVLIVDQNNCVIPLFKGIHFIKRNQTIHHIVNLDMNLFHLGPLYDEDFPISSRAPGESLTNYHLRFRRFVETKTIIKDNQILYPSFQIVYKMKYLNDFDSLNKYLLVFADELMRRDFSVEIRPHIEKMISDVILRHWKQMTDQLDSDYIQKLIKSTPKMLNNQLNLIISKDSLLKFFDVTIFLERIRSVN